MAQYLLNYLGFFDKRDNLHRAAALGTFQRVDFIYQFYECRPGDPVLFARPLAERCAEPVKVCRSPRYDKQRQYFGVINALPGERCIEASDSGKGPE